MKDFHVIADGADQEASALVNDLIDARIEAFRLKQLAEKLEAGMSRLKEDMEEPVGKDNQTLQKLVLAMAISKYGWPGSDAVEQIVQSAGKLGGGLCLAGEPVYSALKEAAAALDVSLSQSHRSLFPSNRIAIEN